MRRAGLFAHFSRDINAIAVIIFILLVEFDFSFFRRHDFHGLLTMAIAL